MTFPRQKLLFSLIIFMTILFSSGCSNTDNGVDLSGYWTGTVRNPATKSGWAVSFYFDRSGSGWFGIYSDDWRSITMRNLNFDGDYISFVVDLPPDSVTFIGNMAGNDYFDGTWSYTDGNNGLWEIRRTEGEFDDEIPTPSTSTTAGASFGRNKPLPNDLIATF